MNLLKIYGQYTKQNPKINYLWKEVSKNQQHKYKKVIS